MPRHPAVEFINDDKRECLICGHQIVGFGKDLRHAGEGIRVVAPAREDANAFARAVSLAEAAIGGLLSRSTTDADRARAAVEAIYDAGLLRRRPAAVTHRHGSPHA